MGKELGFTATKFENVSSRDYGLMRVSKGDGSATPYPRHSKPIDQGSIHDRLLEEQKRILSSLGTRSISQHLFEKTHQPNPSQSASLTSIEISNNIKKQLNGKRSVRMRSRINAASTRSSLTQQLLSMGTPHPKKKIVLNPKTLVNRLSSHAFRTASNVAATFVSKKIGPLGSIGSLTETTESEEFLKSHDMHFKHSQHTSKFKSSTHTSTVVCAKPILKKSSKCMVAPLAPKCAKKVKLIVPKSTWTETMPPQNDREKFAERRRLHDEAEFTICKNGVRLSEIVMRIPDESKFIVDPDLYDHDNALIKIKKILRDQGIICTIANKINV